MEMEARKSARAMLLNAQGQMLWLHVEDNISDDKDALPTRFWCVPGGGLESGETFEEALWTEVLEEFGLEILGAGTHVATFAQRTSWQGQWYLNDSGFYAIRVESPRLGFANATELEKEVFRSFKWWAYEEIKASSELFLPKEIVEVFGAIAEGRWNGEVRQIS